MVVGSLCVLCGVWCVVRGAWCVVRGASCVVCVDEVLRSVGQVANEGKRDDQPLYTRTLSPDVDNKTETQTETQTENGPQGVPCVPAVSTAMMPSRRTSNCQLCSAGTREAVLQLVYCLPLASCLVSGAMAPQLPEGQPRIAGHASSWRARFCAVRPGDQRPWAVNGRPPLADCETSTQLARDQAEPFFFFFGPCLGHLPVLTHLTYVPMYLGT
jgi:hypothetical protein